MVGTVVTYTLMVTNLGPSSATNVTVVDDLPPEVSWLSDTCAAGPPVGQTLTWNVGTLLPGESDTIADQDTMAGKILI